MLPPPVQLVDCEERVEAAVRKETAETERRAGAIEAKSDATAAQLRVLQRMVDAETEGLKRAEQRLVSVERTLGEGGWTTLNPKP